jgi:hypothetical protein
MLHLFQTPKTMAVLPSSSLDMGGHSNRKSPRARPANHLADNHSQIRPQKSDNRCRGRPNANGICCPVPRLVSYTEAARTSRTVAPFAARAKIETRPLARDAGATAGVFASVSCRFGGRPGSLRPALRKAIRCDGGYGSHIDAYAAFHCVSPSPYDKLKTCPIEYPRTCWKRVSRSRLPIRPG